MRFLDAEAVMALGPLGAIDAITATLHGEFDPGAGPGRVPVDVTHGQFLLMPAETGSVAGVKVVTVAPDNPRHGLPRIQASYLLFDSRTLALQAVLDGTALTTLRTPAVSVAAVRSRLPERALDVVVIGAGPQATQHVATLAAVRELNHVTYLVRDPARAPMPATQLGTAEALAALGAADVVVCATSARTPLFDSAQLRDDAIVIAVGSHEADARELDSALLGRATVLVEDVATALREAGDVVLAIAENALTAGDLVTIQDVITGRAELPADQPVVFKSVGMAWEDLAVAEAVVRM